MEWWRRRITKWGAVVAAFVVMFGAGAAVVKWFDGYYAHAGDVQQIQSDVLELRRQLDAERRDIQRVQRQRKLSDQEIDRLQKVSELITGIDRRLESLREKQAGK